ncbi:hypothetical protein [Peristeroidobacter agariperforans]|nr:hypothetical protein [Peristeroidobacter agariperforans]
MSVALGDSGSSAAVSIAVALVATLGHVLMNSLDARGQLPARRDEWIGQR